MSIEALRRAAPNRAHWFHSIEIAPGVWTNGHKTPDTIKEELDRWDFPVDLSGKSVLDIGCADGGFSAAALARGAASVVAIDEQTTTGMRMVQAAGLFPALEFRQIGLFTNEFMQLPSFDFVIFTGVLYHVQDMLDALKRVRLKAHGAVVLETHFNETLGSWPAAAVFYECDELEGDVTNWWGPNVACLEAMFRVAGFDYYQTSMIGEDKRRLRGRVSYMLTPNAATLFGEIAESPTGSNSLLEEARTLISRLADENRMLRAAWRKRGRQLHQAEW